MVIGRIRKYWGEDPSRVVVDEMVGTWIALLAVPENGHWGYMIAAFVLFRFFDILKPLGIRKMENCLEATALWPMISCRVFTE